MNPLEAMAKALCESIYLYEDWTHATPGERAIAFTYARAALNALADNVNQAMIDSYDREEDCGPSIAAAIRAAGEDK
jgi:hypothetical protein